MTAKYEQAKSAGYSDGEIAQYLGGDKYKEATNAGYSDAEIIKHLLTVKSAPPKESSFTDVAKEAVRAALPSAAYNSPIAPTSDSPVKGALEAAGQTLRDPTRIGATVSQPGNVAGKAVKDKVGGFSGKVAGLVTSAALDPMSYLPLGGVAKAAKAIKPGLSSPVEDIIAHVSEQKGPLKDTIEAQTKNVMDNVQGIMNKYGGELNDSKKALGMPTTNAEREASIIKHGNTADIDHADLLKTDTGTPFAAKAYNWKDQGKVYYKIFGDKDQVLAKTEGLHGSGSDVSEDTVKKFAIPIKESPYLDSFKKPEDLVGAISDFKANASKMTEKNKVKTASYLQDQINNHVDWTKPGNQMEGVLKAQYSELKSLALPDSLKASKQKMAEVLDLTSELQKKMEQPGQAEAYLRNIVVGKSARNKDSLGAIKHLETLSGTNLYAGIEKAVKREQAVDAYIKVLEKEKDKATAFKPTEDNGNVVKDLLQFKMSGWKALASHILEYKDQIKAGLTSKAAKRTAIVATGRGLPMSDDNKAQLDNVMASLKRTPNAQ